MSDGMGKVWAIIVIFGGLFGAAYLTKPSEDHFRAWYREQLAKEERSLDENIVGGIVDRAKNAVLGAQGDITTEYEDGTVYATATVHRGNLELTYMGAFGTWFNVSTSSQ